MAQNKGFDADEIERAFEDAGGECCGKSLSFANSRRGGWRGRWEAHHGNRASPVILCMSDPENCHLNCDHDGDWAILGITPRVHKGGGHVR